MDVFMYVCLFAGNKGWPDDLFLYERMNVCICISMNVCICISMNVCICISMICISMMYVYV